MQRNSYSSVSTCTPFPRSFHKRPFFPSHHLFRNKPHPLHPRKIRILRPKRGLVGTGSRQNKAVSHSQLISDGYLRRIDANFLLA